MPVRKVLNRCFYILLPFTLYLWVLPCGAQSTEASLDHLTVDNGLSYDKVRSVLQDTQGFIWIGTLNGLNRYDGHRFKKFFHDADDSSSLPDNRIQKLYEDSKGNLWVCTLSGISLYNPVTEKFKNFFQRDENDATQPVSCYAISENEGKLWAATAAGVRFINDKTFRLDHFPGHSHKDFINSRLLYDIVSSPNGYLLGAGFNGIVKMHPQKNSYELILLQDENPSHSIPDNQVNKIIEESDTIWWIGTWSGGLKKFNPVTKKFITYFPEDKPAYTFNHNIVRQIISCRENNRYLWISGSIDGFSRFDKRSGKFELFFQRGPWETGINPGPVFTIYEDRQNRIWMGNDAGIYVFDPARQYIKQRQIQLAGGPSCDKTIVRIYQDPADITGNSFWVSTRSCGVFLCDSLLRHIKKNDLSGFIHQLFTTSRFTVFDFLRSSDDCFWLAAGTEGLLLIDKKKKTYLHWGNKNLLRNNIPGFEGFYFRKLLQDKQGVVWIATGKGLLYYDSLTAGLKTFSHPVLQSENVQYLEQDNDGNIWAVRICSDRQEPLLYRISHRDRTVTAFSIDIFNNAFCSGQNFVNSFVIDSYDNLWFSGPDGRLIKATVQQEKITTRSFTQKEGMPPYRINLIKEKDSNHLWLASSHGLMVFDKKNETIEKSFSRTDGLLISDNTYMYADNKKRLFIRGPEGKYNLLRNYSETIDTAGPVLIITGVYIFNEPYLHPRLSISKVNELVLKHTQNNLQIEFAALDYTNPQQQEFAYKLESLDKNWITTKMPLALYSNLRPGKYLLRIKGAGGNGVWNEKGISLTVIINPPFRQTWLFRLIVLSLVTAVAYFIIKKRIAVIRKEEKLKQMKAEAEMKALRAQMNPHFIFNCLNTIDAYILKNRQEEASDILQKFSQLIRLVLENSRHDLIPLEEEIKALELYVELEQFILEKSFVYNIQVSPVLLEKTFQVPPLLFQPYVENAILHGLRHKKTKDGLLKIEFRFPDKLFLQCIIEDNGIGRIQSARINRAVGIKKESLGTEVTKERIDNLNERWKQHISVKIDDLEENEHTGTRVEIRIPAKLPEN